MNLIEACGWDKAQYFFFSDNVFDPLIYYSHLGPFVASSVLLLFIILTNNKSALNRTLILMVSFFCVWTLMDLILWASEKPEFILFFWSALLPIDFGIYALALYFSFIFLFPTSSSKWLVWTLALISLPIVFLTGTHYNIEYFDFTNCEREVLEGRLWTYAYIIDLIMSLAIFGMLLFSMSRRGMSRSDKLEKLYVILGILSFLVLFSWGNIVGSITNDWSIGQYGAFGMPIFIAFLAYSIVKYETLNIKTLAVQVLVAAIVVLIGAQLFFIKAFFAKVLTVIALVATLFFGLMLIKSTKREIDQRKEIEKIATELARSNERLKELDTAKSEFISIASHQLRTPLTAIKGYVSLILEGSYGAVSKDVEDVLNKVYSVNNRLAQLVEDLLNVSRIEAGRIQYNFQPTQIADILSELHDMFLLPAKEKNLEFTLTLPEHPLPKIIVDPNKIKEVTSNLIDNAIKYTPAGKVNIALETKGANARITISDTGVGIKPEDKDNLFSKFVRSKETSRMVVGGAGLGLYVGKSFILAHKGNIWASSEGPGKGSEFIIELPIVNTALQTGTTEKAREA